MKSLIARYRVNEDSVDAVKSLVREFVTKVKDNEPETLVYESYQLKDAQEFVHIMKFQSEVGKEFHKNTEWCKEFVEKLCLLCEVEPEFTELSSFY